MSALIRWGWSAAGWVLVGIAVLGAFTPVLPTTPLLLLAVFCFARGSPRLEGWLVDHPRFGPPIRDWRQHGTVSRRAKVSAVSLMAASACATWVFAPPWASVGATLCMAAVACWLILRPEPNHS